MSRGNVLLPRMQKVALTLEKHDPTTIDREGAPAYLAPVTIMAVARKQDEEIVTTDGQRLATDFSIWTLPTEDEFPAEQDRVTYVDPHTSETEIFIGAMLKKVETFKGQVHHYKTLCRRE